MTECLYPDLPKRLHERAAKRLAALLTRKGPRHRIQPCGRHWHVYPDPLIHPVVDIEIPGRARWRRP